MSIHTLNVEEASSSKRQYVSVHQSPLLHIPEDLYFHQRRVWDPQVSQHKFLYKCSPTRYTKCFNEWVLFSTYVSSTCFGPHRSIIRSVFYKLYSQTLVCGTTVRTTRHVQPLFRNGWTCRVVRVLPHTKSVNTACTKRSWRWTGEVRNMSSWHKCWINSVIKTLCVSCWTAYILQDGTPSVQCQVKVSLQKVNYVYVVFIEKFPFSSTLILFTLIFQLNICTCTVISDRMLIWHRAVRLLINLQKLNPFTVSRLLNMSGGKTWSNKIVYWCYFKISWI